MKRSKQKKGMTRIYTWEAPRLNNPQTTTLRIADELEVADYTYGAGTTKRPTKTPCWLDLTPRELAFQMYPLKDGSMSFRVRAGSRGRKVSDWTPMTEDDLLVLRVEYKLRRVRREL